MNDFNVLDHMKEMTADEIAAEVRTNTIPAAAAMLNIEGDFNFAQMVRSANFFGLERCFYAGKRKWDRRAAVGTHNYTPVQFVDDPARLVEEIRAAGYVPVAVENNVNYEMFRFTEDNWPLFAKPCVIFGSEAHGLPSEVLDECAAVVTIPGRGSVRSLNVGASAATIFSYLSCTVYSQW